MWKIGFCKSQKNDILKWWKLVCLATIVFGISFNPIVVNVFGDSSMDVLTPSLVDIPLSSNTVPIILEETKNVDESPRVLLTKNNTPVMVTTNLGDIFSILSNHRGIPSEDVINAPDSIEISDISKVSSRIAPPPNPDIGVWVTVPKVWTQGSGISIKFEIFNDGFVPASLYLDFYSYDPGVEIHLNTPVYVPRGSFKTYYLTGTVPSTTVGLKGASATVTGAISLQWDLGYNHVQIFGNNDLHANPIDDDMASESSNPVYYYEGLSNDGWNIAPEYALWHCTDWSLRYKAGSWADGCITPYACGREIAQGITSYIIYAANGDYYYYTVEDRRVLEDRKGVCDEKAVLMISMWRSMGLPGRLIEANDGGSNTHAWGEVWDGFRWVHADPTMVGGLGILLWDDPCVYSTWPWYPTWVYVQIQSFGDDSKYHSEGPDTDGNLQYYWDFGYICGYDGSNYYCYPTSPPYDIFNDPYG